MSSLIGARPFATHLFWWMREPHASIVITRAGMGGVGGAVAGWGGRKTGVLSGRHGPERLAVGPVNQRLALLRVQQSTIGRLMHAGRVAEMGIGGVRGYEGMRL